MLIATLIAASALHAAPASPIAAAPWSLANPSGAAGRAGASLPHPDAAKAAPKHKVASRIVCHPDPTKSIGCSHDKAREAAEQRAEAARKANEA
ncbi:hypothetical protein GGQ88_002823 [Novosphingobium hassiacum]|uniref:Uncharacterized protein n=1 Tax=Novosphingobium hassiacum TaxID=173676 RepID=A0A7W5ZZS4_9SPHN|nr:hypothetical protein [Novosphingobium hassiacum]MBB3861539.1 hypothetical protein [Novosphingobium hassiacum]